MKIILSLQCSKSKTISDDTSLTSITFLNGFIENNIVAIDDTSPDFGDSKTNFLFVEMEKSTNLLRRVYFSSL